MTLGAKSIFGARRSQCTIISFTSSETCSKLMHEEPSSQQICGKLWEDQVEIDHLPSRWGVFDLLSIIGWTKETKTISRTIEDLNH